MGRSTEVGNAVLIFRNIVHAKWDGLDETLVCFLPAPFGFYCMLKVSVTGHCKRTENCCRGGAVLADFNHKT